MSNSNFHRMRRQNRNSDDWEEELDSGFYREEPRKKRCCTLHRCLIWSVLTIFGIMLFLFILIFVIFPLVFQNSLKIQTFAMFPNFDQPSNPEFDNFEKYGAVGVRNIYVDVKDTDGESNVSLGVWHVLPEEYRDQTVDNPNFDYEAALRSGKHDVVIYFHGNSGTRIFPLPTYEVLRKYFHVIAPDYRNYGDSTPAELSEPAVVNDMQQFYKWVRSQTNARIYVWAHSLGTSLGTHTVAVLKSMNVVPTGLMLEAPFTTMREELEHHPVGKVFAWLAYFDATIRDPLEENGFHFWTTTYILNVTCPIMIVHAEDDVIIPWRLSQKLARVADENIDKNLGNVTYHLVPANVKANHMEVNRWPELPKYIEEFIDTAEAYNSGRG